MCFSMTSTTLPYLQDYEYYDSWNDALIKAGSIDVDGLEPNTTQVRIIQSAAIHPDYIGFGNFINDVCLLTLKDDLIFNDNVNKISLNTEDVPANTKCVVSGWGTLAVSCKNLNCCFSKYSA